MESSTTNDQVSSENATTQETDSLQAQMDKGKEWAKNNPVPAGKRIVSFVMSKRAIISVLFLLLSATRAWHSIYGMTRLKPRSL